MCLSASQPVMHYEMRAGAGGKAMATHWVFPLMPYVKITKITLHYWKLQKNMTSSTLETWDMSVDNSH